MSFAIHKGLCTLIGEYKSLTDAEMATHTQKAHICDCCKGNRKYANGFLWKYND